MVLSEAQRSRVKWVVDYLEASNGAHGAAGNVKVAEELERAFCDLCPGWFPEHEKCSGGLQHALHDAPVLTLLKVILCVSDSCV